MKLFRARSLDSVVAVRTAATLFYFTYISAYVRTTYSSTLWQETDACSAGWGLQTPDLSGGTKT